MASSGAAVREDQLPPQGPSSFYVAFGDALTADSSGRAVRANGVARDDLKPEDTALVAANPELLNNPPPGTITAGEGQGVIMGEPVPHQVPDDPTERGGTIRLVALGDSMSANQVIADTAVLSSAEKSALQSRSETLAARDGDVWNFNQIEARGGTGEDEAVAVSGHRDSVARCGSRARSRRTATWCCASSTPASASRRRSTRSSSTCSGEGRPERCRRVPESGWR